MDPNHRSDPQTIALIERTITPEALEKLTHYALAKLGQKSWRGVWNGKIPGGVQAEDLATSAIESVLIGDPKQGGRRWDPQANPDLMNFLRDIIDSKASHLVERQENISEREPTPVQGETTSDFLDRKRDHRTVEPEPWRVTPDEEAANERLFFALLEEVKEDPILPRILECKWDGITGRSEIAAKLGVDANAITQAGKRLERMLPKFREKYAHMNPFKDL